LHGLGFGRFFWDFASVPGYNFAAALASAGQVSVIIDRLGYGSSDHPVGYVSCVGGQADIAHQIVGQLRSGAYKTDRSSGPAFARVGLVGHSAGGLVAQVEAYSFHDIDVLGVMSWADLGSSQRATLEFAKTGLSCLSGGKAQPAGPSGYAFFGQNASDFVAVMFHNADPGVVAATVAQRTPDPCGDTASIVPSLGVDMLRVPTISVPVLLVYGDEDALFPPPAGEQQRMLYRGTHDVSLLTLANTGHAVTLERAGPTLAVDTASWLQAHGF
jgi:pimeloyl-ACP methyl ester carboxylesterase